MGELLLDVRDLHVSLSTYLGEVQAVRGVSFHIEKGEKVALVGESGCGKSITAKTLMRLAPGTPTGQVLYQGQDVLTQNTDDLTRLRGPHMAMVFQDPMTSLNPTMRVGQQIVEGLIRHQMTPKADAQKHAVALLEQVGIPDAQRRALQYPHEFSGGMRQRAMIAIATACRPRLLIADEPTTALDVTIQAQILDLLQELNRSLEMSLLLITHDLSVVASSCDRVLVMYAGRIVEQGTLDDIFYHPQHPYTRALIQAVPNLEQGHQQKLQAIEGSPANLLAPPRGCAFHPRCPYAMQLCASETPPLKDGSACWLRDPHAPDIDDFDLKRWVSS